MGSAAEIFITKGKVLHTMTPHACRLCRVASEAYRAGNGLWRAFPLCSATSFRRGPARGAGAAWRAMAGWKSRLD